MIPNHQNAVLQCFKQMILNVIWIWHFRAKFRLRTLRPVLHPTSNPSSGAASI